MGLLSLCSAIKVLLRAHAYRCFLVSTDSSEQDVTLNDDHMYFILARYYIELGTHIGGKPVLEGTR